jgi:F420-dependent methylenetetrahydromethanopterin dehydrogenase
MVFRLGKAYDVTLGTVAATPPNPIPIGVQRVRLQATADCYVTISPNGAAPVPGAATLLTADTTPTTVLVDQGSIISVIKAGSTAGVLNITELTF